MQTLFDIGDVIEFLVRAKVKNYEIDEHGDCYVLELECCKSDPRLYVSTEHLTSCGARKVIADQKGQ